jgi:hypothetical protein
LDPFRQFQPEWSTREDVPERATLVAQRIERSIAVVVSE